MAAYQFDNGLGCGDRQPALVVLLYLHPHLSQALIANCVAALSRPCRGWSAAERELRFSVSVDGFLVPTGIWRKNTFTSGVYSASAADGFNVQVVGSWLGT